MSVTDLLNKIAAKICDEYCKFPAQCKAEGKTKAELDAICDNCPLRDLGL